MSITMLERQDKGIVNLENTFTIDIEQDWIGGDTLREITHSVRAYAPSAVDPGQDLQPIYAVLYESKTENDCTAYLEWLKGELIAPVRLIRHTFVAPSERASEYQQVAEDAMEEPPEPIDMNNVQFS